MIKFHWLVENQIVLMMVEGDITLESLSSGLEELRTYLDSSEAIFVHVLLDDQQVGAVPPSLLQLRQVAVEMLSDTKIGWVLSVRKNKPIVDFFASILTQIMKIRYRRMETMHEALAFLQDQDATLPDLSTMQLPEQYA